ncbi:ABC transporter substrate-binding protein [Kribbella sp. NPDC026611]|uniref:ABC transporter substrate-binding protein n=1 Tax=Kribbella sp. NPDC026611 TaxID=3154911 RepID=UPI0033D63A5B
MNRKIRRLIAPGVVVALAVGFVVVRQATGDGKPAVVKAVDEGPRSARGFIEPPSLAEKVAAGTLPPIDQRLPEQPFVVGPGTLIQNEYMDWQDGKYGGTFKGAATFPSGWLNIAGGATILRSPSQSTAVSAPNIVSAFSHSDDYKTFKFSIRKGLRWSDGVPLTTEDVRFPFEDMYQDKNVQTPWPTELYTQGNANLGPATLKIVDQYNFELDFSRPYGSFIADLNSWIPYYNDLFKPAHYLKQFHQTYAKPAALAALVKSNRRANWVQLLTYKDVLHWDAGDPRALGMPTLNAWVLSKSTENRSVYDRNPYFWHVDKSGHQLPYVDQVVIDRVVDTDALTNAVLGGQVSIASGGEVALNKMPVYKQNAERSKFRVFTTKSFNNPLVVYLNQDYQYQDQSSVWQKLMADPAHRFGKAIEAAIDPEGISKSVYFGLYNKPGPEWQGHDPALAKTLLDEVGMNRTDSKGFRLGPDGKPFVFRLTHSAGSPDFDPVAELLKEQLGQVGINVQIERIEGTLFDQRKAANQIMASMAWNDGPAWASGMSEDFLPASKGPWSPATWTYFTSNGKEGRKPPAYLQKFYDLYTARKAFPPESPQGKKAYDDLMAWFRQSYVFIPTAGVRVTPNIVDARLRNVQKEGSPYELDTYINAEATWFADE